MQNTAAAEAKTEPQAADSSDKKINTSMMTLRGISRGFIGLRSRMMVDEERSISRPDFGNPLKKISNAIDEYLSYSPEALLKSITTHLNNSLGIRVEEANKANIFVATALTVRDRMVEILNDSQSSMYVNNSKRLYYVSTQFFVGKNLKNAIKNMQLENQIREALMNIDANLYEVIEEERDLAYQSDESGFYNASMLDSMASLNLPAYGYGLRYTFGEFKQKLQNGKQVEIPNFLAGHLNPFEIERQDQQYHVGFGGVCGDQGSAAAAAWQPAEFVIAQAYDLPLPGYDTFNALALRLWRALPNLAFLKSQNLSEEELALAIERAEKITLNLSPDDPEVNLKQKYLLASATIKNIIHRYKKTNKDIKEMPQKIIIQVNDCNQVLLIIELYRILVDEEGVEPETAADIVTRVFVFNCHAINRDNLKSIPVELLGRILPRHLQIVYDLNHRWMIKAKARAFDAQLSSLSLIEESHPKRVRMHNLAFLFASKVVAVSKQSFEFQAQQLFPDFVQMFSDRLMQISFGVSPRVCINNINTELSKYYTDMLVSSGWLSNGERLSKLADKCDDPETIQTLLKIKSKSKKNLVKYISRELRI